MIKPALPAIVLGLSLGWLGTPGSAAEADPSNPLTPVVFRTIRIDGFWGTQFKRLTEMWLPHCVRQMEAGGEGQELLNLVHTSAALKGEPHGEFTGLPWSDAYVYNTVESICLALTIDAGRDAEWAAAQARLRDTLEAWIPIILAAQCDDGYIHSYHVVNGFPRYTNINAHEFYVQGYFLEMGVAHYRMTGGSDRRLYDAAIRCADQLCTTFGPPPKRIWVHGHAGMGYALCRLARLVNQVEGAGRGDKYFQLAKFLLDTRHTVEEHRSAYRQSHRPVVEMDEAVGHAVRATYFYTAMADLAMLTGDRDYLAAVDRIWDSAINRKHYLTGGVGASHQGEAFAGDFDLRNDGYCESCAGCGLTFWADRMLRIHRDAWYIDVQERTLYNNVLGAIELSGENFFYQNPLASDRARYSWHGCPCCVGNIPRTLLAIKDQMYALDADRGTLYVNHFVAGEGTIADVAGTPLRIRQETAYPWAGDIRVVLNPQRPVDFALKLRVPDPSAESALYTVTPESPQDAGLTLNGATPPLTGKLDAGYLTLSRRWNPGDVVSLHLPLQPQRVHADPRARADRGRVALIRGPITYSVENEDHEVDVRDLILPPDSSLSADWRAELLEGVMAITGRAEVERGGERTTTRLTAIPNFARLNRGGWSQVWITEDPTEIVPSEALARPEIKPIVREDLDKRTLDRVVIGDPASEREHDLQGENTSSGVFRNRRWRHAGNGWFSYRLKVEPDVPNRVLCTYWGSDVGNRRFQLLVDGRQVGRQVLDRNVPGNFFDVEYAIPAESLDGKQAVTVRIQADAGAMAGGVFDLRIVRPAASP